MKKHKCFGYSFVPSSKQSPSQISAEMPRQGTAPAAVAKQAEQKNGF